MTTLRLIRGEKCEPSLELAYLVSISVESCTTLRLAPSTANVWESLLLFARAVGSPDLASVAPSILAVDALLCFLARCRYADAISCPRCGHTSHHPSDIRERYCGACHAFHDDMREQ